MPIRITTAQTPEEIDHLFQLRHAVYSGECNFEQRSDGRIFDRFDAMPACNNNIVAKQGDEIIGAMRITLQSSAGIPADDYFDFRPYLPSDARVGSVGMLFTHPEHRGNPLLLRGMFLRAFHWLSAQGATHAVAPINPILERHLRRAGFQTVAPLVEQPGKPPIVPMQLDVADAAAPYVQYVAEQSLLAFADNFQRDLYGPGEFVLRKGEEGHSCYVVADGELEVRDSVDAGGRLLAVLKAGDLFGEVALLTRLRRTASVIAKGHVHLMSLSRERFLEEMLQKPERAIELLKLLGDRLQTLFGTSTLMPGALESIRPPASEAFPSTLQLLGRD